MRPHLLVMQAFGPFAGQQTIDFSELGDKHFFLIHGPTGSGKTTILDGICFALFGDSSGGEREGKGMRSDHAGLDTLTEVRFEFSLGAGRYRVRRVPEQQRRALRGGGETKQNPLAELWRLEGSAGEPRPLASGWREVSVRVSELLGFESGQFRQVIMLPQGRFRDFLLSKSGEREQILQTLFGTELYRRIEQALKHSAAALERQADTLRAKRRAVLDQAGVEGEDALAVRAAEQQVGYAACGEAETAAARAASEAEAHLARAREIHAHFVEFDGAQAEAAALEGRRAHWQAERGRLAGARKAAAVSPHAERVHSFGVELARAAAELKTRAAAREAAALARDEADKALAAEQARAPEIEAALRRQGELAAIAGKVAALAEARAALAREQQAQQAAEAALAGATKATADARAALQALQQRRQQAELAAARLAGDEAAAKRLEELQTRGAELEAIQARLAVLATAHEQAGRGVDRAAEALAGARRACDDTRAAWVAGLAGRLARRLVDGEACPVCGASEHPAPAHDAATVSDEALQVAEKQAAAAEKTLRAAEQAQAKAHGELALATQRRDDLQRALGEAAGTPVGTLAAQRTDVGRRVEAGRAAAGWLRQADAALADAQATAGEAEARERAASTALAEARERATTFAAQCGEREATVPAELADPTALQAAAREVEQRLATRRAALAGAEARAKNALAQASEADSRYAAASEQHQRLQTQAEGAARELQRRLAAAGLADEAAYRAALLDDEALAALDEAILAFEAALKSAAERATRAAQATAGLARPDLAGCEAAHRLAREAHLEAGRATEAAKTRLAETRRTAEALARLKGEFDAVETRYGIARQLADVASGNNPQRMSFQRYVLATLLDEVLAAATQRLRVMSRGRYELQRRLDPADQRRAAGLDLEIFDHYTGKAREVGTLSGGESFLAALALALGLSDVVQAYAGGIRLDAIFVDEGFGTLDPEALEHAIRALKDLQQAGRMVGIISHVAELKEWIDARLELETTPQGSRAAFSV